MNNRTMTRLLALLLCAMLLLCGCARMDPMDFENDRYTNRETGISYFAAPAYYEASSILDEGVAKLKRKRLDDLVFYQVDGVPTSMYLASASYELYCAEGVKLPELWEMTPQSFLICQTEMISIAFAEVTDAKLISDLVGLYREGTGLSHKDIDPGLKKEKYDLKFSSPAYPGIYYCLTYWQFEKEVLIYDVVEDLNDFEIKYPGVEVTTEEYHFTENGEDCVELYAVYHFGTGILYNRTTGRCVPAGGLLDAYFEEASEETSA